MSCGRCGHPKMEHEVLESRQCCHLCAEGEPRVVIKDFVIPPELAAFVTDDFCCCRGYTEAQQVTIDDRRTTT